MNNRTNMRIPKKYQGRIELVEYDEDGLWIYLNYGWRSDDEGLHIIHEDSQRMAMLMLRGSGPCHCRECTPTDLDTYRIRGQAR